MRARVAVFLDRDGVLNRVTIREGLPVGPVELGQFILTQGAAHEVGRLKDAGYIVIVATNQPDLASGRLDPDVLNAMHAKLRAEVPVDAIYVCPHDDGAHCLCRKPLPGLLLSAARDHDIDLSRSFMVGDRWRDVEAGKAANCRTILVNLGYNERLTSPPDWCVADLAGAVEAILGAEISRGAR